MTELRSIDAARVALRALVDEYAVASDTLDGERYASLFTPDAEFVTKTPPLTLHGREEIKLGPSGNKIFEQTLHAVHNHVVDIHGDHANGITYCTARHLLRNKDDSLEVILAPIRYRDEYELTEDGWKFSRRELEWTWIERIRAEPFRQWWLWLRCGASRPLCAISARGWPLIRSLPRDRAGYRAIHDHRPDRGPAAKGAAHVWDYLVAAGARHHHPTAKHATVISRDDVSHIQTCWQP